MHILMFILCAVLALSSTGMAQEPSNPNAQQSAASTLPEDPLTSQAREAYNASRFNEAGRLFRQVARKYPENPAVYRAMARAFSWAEEHTNAIIAYRQYLAMASGADDASKVQAELDLVSKKVDTLPPVGPPSNVRQALDAIEARAQAGRFNGREGAFGALDAILESSWVGPEIAIARKKVSSGLARHSAEAVDRWWSPSSVLELTTAAELTLAWEGLSGRLQKSGTALSSAEQRMKSTIDGLAALADGQYKSALQKLDAASGQDHRIRFAQAIALMKLKRYREVVQLCRALSRYQEEPRILLLLGMAELKNKQKTDGIETLVDAMEAGVAQ